MYLPTIVVPTSAPARELEHFYFVRLGSNLFSKRLIFFRQGGFAPRMGQFGYDAKRQPIISRAKEGREAPPKARKDETDFCETSTHC